MYSTAEICNIMVRIKCCFADYSVKRIEASAIGDKEEADCWRKKLRMLRMLYHSFCQYTPVIEAGYNEEQEVEVSDVTDDVTFNAVYVAGIRVSNPQFVTGNAKQVTDAVADSVNNFTSDRDAELQVTAVSRSDADDDSVASLILGVTYISDLRREAPIEISAIADNATISTSSTSDPEAFEGESLYCLTEDEVTTLISKFNALCGCGCGDGMFSDNLPKYVS